jgi:16S rRNA (cytidine1402-2'-O)-methyltransferase
MISDAGTPSISDPGKILIQSCVNNKIDIFPIPGPSAVSTAISISGFSDKFYFNGFISDKESENEKNFLFLSNLNISLVFFISAKKINKIIKLIKKYFLDRDIVICKEMTKFYEEYFRSSIKNLKEFENNLKGEITIIISEKKNIKKDSKKLNESDKKKIRLLINKITTKDIISIFSGEKNVSKKEIYNYCISLKNEN